MFITIIYSLTAKIVMLIIKNNGLVIITIQIIKSIIKKRFLKLVQTEKNLFLI